LEAIRKRLLKIGEEYSLETIILFHYIEDLQIFRRILKIIKRSGITLILLMKRENFTTIC